MFDPLWVAQSLPFPAHCALCHSLHHSYTRCPNFDGHQLCFVVESDHLAVRVMEHESWFVHATMHHVQEFLRRVTTQLGYICRLPQDYHVIVNGICVDHLNKDVRCCEVGLLPGCIALVVLARHSAPSYVPGGECITSTDSFSDAAFDSLIHAPLATIPSVQFGHSSTFQVQASSRHAKKERELIPHERIRDPDSLSQNVSVQGATPPKKEPDTITSSECIADVSCISLASTSLLRSVPAQHGQSTAEAPIECVDTSRQLQKENQVDPRPDSIAVWADLSIATNASAGDKQGNVTPDTTTRYSDVVKRADSDDAKSRGQKQNVNSIRSGLPGCTLHFKFIPATMAFPDMRTMFFAAGDVSKVRVVVPDEHADLKNRFCLAFVEYTNVEGARRAMTMYDRHKIGKFRLAVTMSKQCIDGGHPTDATSREPCSFGLSTAAPITPNKNHQAQGMETPNSRRENETTSGSGYRLTPKMQKCTPKASLPNHQTTPHRSTSLQQADSPTQDNVHVEGGLVALLNLNLHDVPNFAAYQGVLQEYCHSPVEATYYNAVRGAERLCLSCEVPALLLDLQVIRCAVYVFHGTDSSIKDAQKLALSDLFTTALRIISPTSPDNLHAIACLITVAALVQPHHEATAISLLCKVRETVHQMGLNGGPLKMIDDFVRRHVEVRKAQKSIRWIGESLFPSTRLRNLKMCAEVLCAAILTFKPFMDPTVLGM